MEALELKRGSVRAFAAEDAGQWHVAVQHYLLCLEQAHETADAGAAGFFAAKLARAYRIMGMPNKASYFELYGDYQLRLRS